MRQRFLVYGLVDPRTGETRYIGKSTSGMKRPRQHGRPWALARDPGHRTNWIRSLAGEGFAYGIVVLYRCESNASLGDAERFWIAEGRRRGWRLTNQTDGGEGSPGLTPTAEARDRMRKAHLGYVPTDEHRAKLSSSGRGRKLSAESRKRISAAKKGHRMPPETRAKISASRTGQRRAPEVRARIAESMRALREKQRASRAVTP